MRAKKQSNGQKFKACKVKPGKAAPPGNPSEAQVVSAECSKNHQKKCEKNLHSQILTAGSEN
jgi:hypothetical protein